MTITPMAFDIRIHNDNLVLYKNIVYFKSTISESAKLDNKMMYRLSTARAARGRLQEKLWNNHHVSVKVKNKLFKAVVLFVLLYESNT